MIGRPVRSSRKRTSYALADGGAEPVKAGNAGCVLIARV